jgi:transforming growth factor-beta-induced protein
MNGKEFLALVDSSGLKTMLSDNVTVFLPSDDAIEDFRHDLEKLNAVDQIAYNVDDGLVSDEQQVVSAVKTRSKRSSELTVVESPNLADILKNHMVEGFFDSSLLNDEQVLNTTNPDSKLRITVYNTYPEKVVMANCAKVTSKDHFATNGLVHTVDKVILPATKTIADIIDSDVQFRSLAEALKKAKLMDLLSQPGQFTLFAPTDDAVKKLDQKTRAKVMAGNGCSQDILKHHLLPNVICSSVVESKAKTLNLLDKYMILERKEDDSLLVEGKRIEMKDIVATNGVIQVIEEVLIPESARSVEEALAERGATTLHELFQLAGISEGLDAFSNNTIFAPSEKALAALPKEFLDELKADKKKLQDFLMYHVATPKTCKCEFQNNRMLQSGLKDKQLRINAYDNVPFAILDTGSARQVTTVQCARITELDDEICGGMIHTVEKVLLPPGGKAVEVIKNGDKFSKFLALVEFAELENELNTDGPFTVLAPTDSAFEHLDAALSKKAFSDKDTAARLVHHHVLPDVVCCSGIARHVPFFDLSGHRTQGGETVSLRRSRGGHIYAERAEITTCDMVADNGVVHALDRVMVPDALADGHQEDDATSSEEVGSAEVPAVSNRRYSPLFNFKLFK